MEFDPSTIRKISYRIEHGRETIALSPDEIVILLEVNGVSISLSIFGSVKTGLFGFNVGDRVEILVAKKLTNKATKSERNIHAETDRMLFQIDEELERAREKFPTQTLWVTLAALSEEVGELNQAALHKYIEHKVGASVDDIYEEAVQVAVMAIRVALDTQVGQDRYHLDTSE